MHDMSNTRKEIAARLGFAAKEVFADKRTTAGALRKALKAKGITSADDLEWHGISPNDPDSTPYWLYEDGSMEKIKSSRPGAKVAFDNKQIAQGLSRLLKETGFDGMASDVLSGPSDSETLRKYVRVLKGKMSPLSGDAKSAELLSKLEKMLSARAGAKAKFAPQIDEAEQELKAWTKKLGYYPDMAKVNVRPNTVMLWFYDQKGKATQLASKLRSVAASMNLSPSAITSEEGRHPAYDGGAARDVGQVTVDYNRSTKAARPGAKTRMTREQTEEQKAGLKIMSAADPAVGAKIAKLIKEGKPQDQAVAIALDMKRRGEL